jgi:type VI secretion system protein ImpA
MSEANLDFGALLAPIPGDVATGTDLRNDQTPSSAYDKIREARMLARDAERRADQGFDGAGDGLAAWRSIVESAPAILATQSKDLEIAAMLTEGLVRFHGYAGLRDGLRLIHELVEAFWGDLYPKPDEDGIIARLLPVINLNGEEPGADGTLVQPLRRIPITAGGEPGPYNLAQYEQAQQLAGLQDERVRQQRLASGAVTVEMIATNASQTPRPFFVALLADLDGCIAEHQKLYEALDRICGSDSPSGKRIGDILAKAREALLVLSPGLAAPAAQTAPAPQTNGAAAPAGVAAVPGSLASREDAFALLMRVADFFRRAEPQSTVPYVLEELVRRAKLPLPQLLEELIQDENARRQFLVSAGIKPVQTPAG